MTDYVDALVNKIMPDTQIGPIVAPEDQISESEMVFAEQVGLKIIENTDGATLTASPTVFTDSTNSPFSIADIGRYIYIRSGANLGMYRISAIVDASNVELVNPDGTNAALVTQTNIDYGLHEEPS